MAHQKPKTDHTNKLIGVVTLKSHPRNVLIRSGKKIVYIDIEGKVKLVTREEAERKLVELKEGAKVGV